MFIHENLGKVSRRSAVSSFLFGNLTVGAKKDCFPSHAKVMCCLIRHNHSLLKRIFLAHKSSPGEMERVVGRMCVKECV